MNPVYLRLYREPVEIKVSVCRDVLDVVLLGVLCLLIVMIGRAL